MIWFSGRKKLENKYKEWIKENNIADTSFNVITFLEIQGLLSEDKIKDFLEGVN